MTFPPKPDPDTIYQPTEIKTYLDNYSNNPKGFLLLAGENGTGKSFAAMKIYERNTSYSLPQYNDEEAIFLNQSTLNFLFGEHQSKWGSTHALLKRLIMTPLLVLDDIGTKDPTPSFMDLLYAVVDMRYTNRQTQSTILTTNMNSKDMRAKFGDAFTSRVASGKCFRIDGPDRRFNNKF